VKDHFLVVDTETSGLPKKWDLPYDAKNNWPHVVQIAWIIFNAKGEELKRENHYIKNNDFKISKSAQNIHHLDSEFLKKNGKDRLHVMQRLAKDLENYQPLIIAHFVELDFHMICAEFFRTNIKSNIGQLPLFCTMKASKPYIKNPSIKYLKLNRFYKTIFNKRPEKLHDALSDALLTAEIFFYLLQNGEIDDVAIAFQQNLIDVKNKEIQPVYKWLSLIIVIILTIVICWFSYGK